MFHAKFGVNYTPYRLQCRTRARTVLGFLVGSGVFGSWRKSTKGERTGVTETVILSGKLNKRVHKNLTQLMVEADEEG